MRALATVALTVLAARLAPAQAPLEFGAATGSTYVDVFATRDGRPLGGLRAADFELTDDGVVQPVELVSVDAQPLQTLLVFDTSSSVVGEKLAALRTAGEAFLEGLRAGDTVALFTFCEEITRVVEPTHELQEVRAALAELHAHGATAVFDALYAALVLTDPRSRSLLVLFTDGDDNSSILDAGQVQTLSERSNVLIELVGVRPALAGAAPGESPNARALRTIAERTGGRFRAVDSPRRLREALAAIVASMRERYVLRFEPRGVRPGWHRLAVRLRRGQGTLRARDGYWVAGPATDH